MSFKKVSNGNLMKKKWKRIGSILFVVLAVVMLMEKWSSYLEREDEMTVEMSENEKGYADAFYQRLCSRMESRYMADLSEMRKECGRLETRNQEIDDIFLSLYSDKAKGVLTEQRFMKLTVAMEQEV